MLSVLRASAPWPKIYRGVIVGSGLRPCMQMRVIFNLTSLRQLRAGNSILGKEKLGREGGGEVSSGHELHEDIILKVGGDLAVNQMIKQVPPASEMM